MGASAVNRWERAAVVAAAVAVCSPLAGCAGRRKVRIPPPTTTSLESRVRAQEIAVKAQRAADRGRTEQAIELYREAISHDREIGYVWNNLGVLYMGRREYPQAVEAFNRAASLIPGDARPVYNIGQVWMELGYARDALRSFEEALEREPDDVLSLRGAVQAAQLLDIADERTSAWIKSLMLREREQEWIEYAQAQRARVDGRLQAERRRATP
jgi:tetratricopeptide (TPR) repeat protein